MGEQNRQLTRETLADLAEKHHLKLLGVVRLGVEAEYQRYLEWLREGKHAGMKFLENYGHCRNDPRELMEGATTALVFGYSYYQGDKLNQGHHPVVAQYARLRDYHKFLRKSCTNLWAELIASTGSEAKMRVTIDTAPVLERALAKRTQAGFIGKNTLFIHPRHGSYLLLSEIITDLPIESDRQEAVDPNRRSSAGGCGSCKRCQVHCPTGALGKAYQLDARKCLAYYTIEHRDTIPIEFWHGLGRYFFGCDICQLVCPYNRPVKAVKTTELRSSLLPGLEDIVLMSQSQYELWFGGTPMTRAKIDGLQRNALIAMVVMNHPRLKFVINAVIEKELPPQHLAARTVAQIIQYYHDPMAIKRLRP